MAQQIIQSEELEVSEETSSINTSTEDVKESIPEIPNGDMLKFLEGEVSNVVTYYGPFAIYGLNHDIEMGEIPEEKNPYRYYIEDIEKSVCNGLTTFRVLKEAVIGRQFNSTGCTVEEILDKGNDNQLFGILLIIKDTDERPTYLEIRNILEAAISTVVLFRKEVPEKLIVMIGEKRYKFIPDKWFDSITLYIANHINMENILLKRYR